MLILELDPRSFAQSDAHDFWILDPTICHSKTVRKGTYASPKTPVLVLTQ